MTQKESELDAALNRVCDEESFIAFLGTLSEDWFDEQRKEAANPSSPYHPGANGWENGTIGSFLEAASACGLANLRSLNSQGRNDNPWHRAATIIYSGKHYE